VSDNATQLDALHAAFNAATDADKETALGALVEGMRKSAWAITFSLLGRAVPDVVNDAVTGAVQTLHTYQGKARFSTWFYSVVRIHCQMAIKAKLRRSNEISLEQLTDEDKEPSCAMDTANNARIDLDNILSSLDANERELLRLKAEGHTFIEIGKKLGLSSTAAESRWRRLMARIVRERRVQEQHSAFRAAFAVNGSEPTGNEPNTLNFVVNRRQRKP
jgi:RNA polymerase sigma-70 factor (ECF subfamily)